MATGPSSSSSPRRGEGGGTHDARTNTKTNIREHDALSVFTLVLAHCLALQVAKDAQALHLTWDGWMTPTTTRDVDWWSKTAPTLLLAASIAAAHVAPKSDGAPVFLALNGLLVLLINGSQSNHVLLELAIAAAVLLSVPSSSVIPFSFFFSNNNGGGANNKGGANDGAAAAAAAAAASAAADDERLRRRRRRRETFSERMTLSMRAILVVLYATTGFAKLNDAWHGLVHSTPHSFITPQLHVLTRE